MATVDRSLTKVLIANRGEIACRVIRTVRAMGLGTVAVYSEADADAPHVRLAHEAVCIGPAQASASYLDPDRILRAAADSGADAIHPGYGFLSEDAAFAEACEDAGLIFVGPPAAAIARMGNKAEAKRIMQAAGVPCVPGFEGEDATDEELIAAAASLSFPLMVKAAAGGGGRGMRRVDGADELPAALALARAEAASAFGNGQLILEQAIDEPRHVEIQVMADGSGRVIHLGERDCSIQRRHQKVIEEAPCPALTDALRARMGEAAIRAARAIDYVGAGTVEFLLTGNGEFWFLEMNTRLQVEHPVTELVTGMDLVELQIRVARGEALALSQEDVVISGHAIEARLYTEDPARDFAPTTGRIERWRPGNGPGIRLDDGIVTGQAIGPHYDPMVAKLIGAGPTREIARLRLIEALEGSSLFGPVTNKAFLLECLRDPRFVAGEANTGFLAEDDRRSRLAARDVQDVEVAAAAVLRFVLAREAALGDGAGVAPMLLNWSSGQGLSSVFRLRCDDDDFEAVVKPGNGDRYRVGFGDSGISIDLLEMTPETATLELEGRRLECSFLLTPAGGLWIGIAGRDRLFANVVPGAITDESDGSGRITASMHGIVQSVQVAAGEQVTRGQTLLVLEAMKIQQAVTAPLAGTITEVRAHEGQQVSTGDLLFEVVPTAATE